MIALVIALRILTASIPTCASKIFPLADASTSAYDVFVPSPRVRVTGDNRVARGSTVFFGACSGTPFEVFAEVPVALGFGMPFVLLSA